MKRLNITAAAFCIALACYTIRAWLIGLNNSFWLDETLTVWSFRGRSLADTVAASLQRSQPAAYCAFSWLYAHLVGIGEARLRIPSILASILTLWVLYRIGRETHDMITGLLFVASYVSIRAVGIEASDARPYSFALLAESASILFMLRWIKASRRRDVVLWIACAVAGAYFHYVFAVALAVELLFALLYTRRVSVFACAASACLALAPLIPSVLNVSRQARDFSTVMPDLAPMLFSAILPVALVPMVGIALFLALTEGKRPVVSPAFLAAAAMAVTIVAGFYAASRFLHAQLFTPNYMLVAAPAIAITWGAVIDAAVPLRGALAVAIVLICAAISGNVARNEDWRDAVRSASEPMIVYTGLVETKRLNWLDSTEHWGYLRAPVEIYRASSEVDLIPFEPTPEARQYMNDKIASLRSSDVTVLERSAFYGPDWLELVRGELESQGYRGVSRRTFGGIELERFTSPKSTPNHSTGW